MSRAIAAPVEPGAPASASPGASREESWLFRPIVRSGGLRGQLLGGLAVLIVVALLALVCALLIWLPFSPTPGVLLLGVLGLVIADTAVVLLFGHYMMRKNFLRPVERMVDGAEVIADGDLTRRLDETGSEELRRLSRSVNRMADRLIHNQELLAHNVRSLNDTNRALTEARDELIHAEKLASVGRLAAGIAHEVGNPLGAIMGYLEVAERRGAAGQEWLDEIRREAERVDRIVHTLLDFARPRSASTRAVGVEELLRDTVELMRTQGRLDGVEVTVDLEPELAAVTGDSHQIQQVMVNLLLNAADAIAGVEAEGRITVEATTTSYEGPSLSDQPARRSDDPDGVDYSHLRRFRNAPTLRAPAFERGAPLVRIAVTDNGLGLTPEEAVQIFEPFFTTKEPGRGSGLGLAVSARLVEGMGGTITAEPVDDGGATFCVLLPAA